MTSILTKEQYEALKKGETVNTKHLGVPITITSPNPNTTDEELHEITELIRKNIIRELARTNRQEL